MRKYTIPQPMTVEYLVSTSSTHRLGDHPSLSLRTSLGSELRYREASRKDKPWGEIRYSWTAGQTTTPSYTLPQFTFTGQRSYLDDPSTSGVEGFGLMDYNARWYDPSLGRFAQADTIVPGGVEGLDRYAYVNNAPTRFTDPSGHLPIDDECGYQGQDCGSPLPAPPITMSGGGGGFNGNNGGGQPIGSPTPQNLLPTPQLNLDSSCGIGGMVDCPSLSMPNYPSTIILHPLDSNVVSQVPIYDYSYHPPKIIGYRITSYAYGQFHFSVSDYFVPSDPITWTSFIKDHILDPLLKPGIENLATLGIDLSCPVCAAVLTTLSTADSLNSAITFDAHLRTHDIYLSAPPILTHLDTPPILHVP